MQRLQNKVAIITGGAGGMGAATAALFVQEGAKVLLVGRTEEKLRNTVKALNHENISYTVADVSKPEDTQRYVREAVQRYGGVDVLVSNAGVEGPLKHISEHTVEDFDAVMATNVRGVWLSVKYVIPEMQKRGGGSIVLISSSLGIAGSPAHSAYVTSKHAVIGMARSLALDCAPLRIRVNATCPGAIDNAMMDSVHRHLAPGAEEQFKSAFSARIPLKRYGTSEELARLNLFLASDESSYATGQVIAMDGGLTAGVM
jgi:NAD(P)-dependent dehydrogenase (short-subunit alcohol dehydrogenase family)